MNIEKFYVGKTVGFIVVLVLIGGYYTYKQLTPKQEQVFCTMEAKMCPDGSYVGRTGPKCEFTACPGENNASDSGIRGIVMIGPTCPVQRIPPDPQCDDKPYKSNNLFILNADNSNVVRKINQFEDYTFKESIPPGKYKIESRNDTTVFQRCSSEIIEVINGKFTETVVNCDTGIR